MIKKIASLKKFGVFANFTQTTETPDFNDFNIIYGWNYSGKTTLSRLIGCLESRAVHTDYKACEFKILTRENVEIVQDKLASSNLSARVFNSDFVAKNLKWDGQEFDPILLLGEDAIEAKAKLDSMKKKLGNVTRVAELRLKGHAGLETEIRDAYTNLASDIKKRLNLVEAFTRTHVTPICELVKNETDQYVLNDDEAIRLLKDAIASEADRPPTLDKINVQLSLSTELQSVKNVISEIPSFSKTIDYLKDNPSVANWVGQGIELHDGKRDCEYCGNEISEERRSLLLAHFSQDLKEHVQRARTVETKLSKSIQKLTVHGEREIHQSLRSELKIRSEAIATEVDRYNERVNDLAKIIAKKIASPFQTHEVPATFVDNSNELDEKIEAYNDLIVRANAKTDAFNSEKLAAILSLKRHYAATAVIQLSIRAKEQKIAHHKKREQVIRALAQKIDTEILQLEAKISSAQKGREELNTYIETFLGQSKISIDVVSGADSKEKYILRRDKDRATNLSEGEKTAIAFSFFLTKLLETEELNRTVVYIDDPISSLDSNHIFQVNAVLKNFFFSQVAYGAPWTLKCGQLFISTHNFEFFCLLRELPLDKKRNFYYVKRIDRDTSVLATLPRSIEDHDSEYHFLFYELHRFQELSDKSDFNSLMHIPNAVRRFVELYTYARFPSHRGSVDIRMDKLFGKEKSKRVMKVLHHFSHAGNFERIMKNNDLMCDIGNAVDDLMMELKKDTLHYEALLDGLPKKTS